MHLSGTPQTLVNTGLTHTHSLTSTKYKCTSLPLHTYTHTHTHTHTHIHTRSLATGMGRGSEREIGQSACTPPLSNPFTVLAGQENGAGKKGTHIYTLTHTHTHTDTHCSRWGACVFDKMEPVGVQRARLRCVMSST